MSTIQHFSFNNEFIEILIFGISKYTWTAKTIFHIFGISCINWVFYVVTGFCFLNENLFGLVSVDVFRELFFWQFWRIKFKIHKFRNIQHSQLIWTMFPKVPAIVNCKYDKLLIHLSTPNGNILSSRISHHIILTPYTIM